MYFTSSHIVFKVNTDQIYEVLSHKITIPTT